VSELSSLSIATTKRLVEELLSDDQLVEVGTHDNPRGRKASLLQLNGRYCCAVGVNIIPNAIEIASLSFTGRILRTNRIDGVPGNRDSILPIVREEIEKAIQLNAELCDGRFLGIGVGIAGLVNTGTGSVLYSPVIEGWDDTELGSELHEAFSTPVIVDDTVRCMALAEKRYGTAKDLRNYLYVYIGGGVGSGMVLDGRMYRGRHGVAGEFGHMAVRTNGNLCTCGNRGCLEAHVSVASILEQMEKSLRNNIHSSLKNFVTNGSRASLYDILHEARQGDKLACNLIQDVSDNIGIGIANLVNIFDPGDIILGGEVIDAFGDLIMDDLDRSVRLQAINAISTRTRIMRSTVREFAAAQGAATLLIEKYLQNDILNIQKEEADHGNRRVH
jgi:predicted NBD/HSP70 family sugar kinase